MNAAEMWTMLWTGADELAAELGLEAPPDVFTPARALPALDAWLAGLDAALDTDDAARLAGVLMRVLVETHGGGLVQISEADHALAGEWALTGFERGLDADYHVPVVVSAVRIGVDRSLGAVAWYRQLLREGRAAS